MEATANQPKKKNKVGGRIWATIWIAGMIGQLAWVIENQYFNTYIYDQIAPDSNIITWMVVLSAICTTISTFVMGTLSDSIGKRRIFVLLGYTFWGIATIVFGCTQFTIGLIGVTGAGVLVVIADCIMSFFGSMGNDCGFMSWTTDISNPENRGTIGTALSLQPMLSTIIGTVVFGLLLGAFDGISYVDSAGNTVNLRYFMLFLVVGIFVIACGILSFFLMKESPDLIPSREKSFLQSLKKPFNFKLLKENKLLLLILLVTTCFFISFNIYFPHILNYFIYGDFKPTVDWLCNVTGMGEGMRETIAGAIEAIGMVLAIPLLIYAGRLHNQGKFISVLFISVAVNMAGLLVLFLGGLSGVQEVGGLIFLLVGVFLIGGGYMGVFQAIMVWLKNLYPEGMRAQFEGIRILFYVCIPMFLGTLVGNFVIQYLGTPITLTYSTGELTGYAPNGWLYFVAFFVCALTFIPLTFAYFEVKKQNKLKETVES